MVRGLQRSTRRLLIGMVCAASATRAVPAGATENDGTAAAAESVFQEARKLMDARRYIEACPKFAASQKMAPAIGTLLNLADCYEKNNQLASAWARFHEAIALAQRLGRTNREQTAKERADKLEPRLIKLTILSRTSGVDVKLDGAPIDPAALATPIPVDAGKHMLEATAKGKKPFAKEVEVSERQKSPSVDIPPLEDEPKAAVDTGEKREKLVEPPREEKHWPTQKTVGLIVGAVGVVGLGVGGFFGLRAFSKWSETLDRCNGTECDQDGVNLKTEAQNSGNISTVATIAGAALAVGGAILFFTAPKTGKTTGAASMRVGLGPGSLVLGGTFQ